MKFLDPNRKPFDISEEAGSIGALMGEEILSLENLLSAHVNELKVSREDFAAILCVHYLVAAARAASTFFEEGKEEFPLDDFLASAGECARYIEEKVLRERRAAH